MKKKKYILLIIILILIFIILKFYKSKNNIFDDIAIFNLWTDIGDASNNISRDENRKYEYIINPKKHENSQINVFQTIKNNIGIHEKIAPGSLGEFIIKLEKSRDSKCRVIFKSATEKPENLVFILNEKEFNSIEQLEKEANKIIENTDRIIINWEWKYDINQDQDRKDTEDGKNAQNYIFEVDAIIE